MSKCQNVKMSKCQNVKMSKTVIVYVKMSKCQNVKMSKCQNVKNGEEIIEEFKESVDVNCVLHKLETFEKHIKHGTSDGSTEFNYLVEVALAPGKLLYASNTNKQELRRVQMEDAERSGRVKGIVKPGDTRWSHIADSMKRELYLEKYYPLVDVNKTNFNTID